MNVVPPPVMARDIAANVGPIGGSFDPAPENRAEAARWGALAALAVSVLVVAIDTTVVVTALPTLSTELGATTSDLQWVMDAYTIVLAGTLLPAGVLGDRLGRRRFLMLGLLVFGLASVAASQADSTGALITLRALMGLGAAAIMPLSFSILPSLFPAEQRPRAVSVLAATVFLGLPLGPLVAGWLLTSHAWGSIFLINVPIVVAAIVGIRLLVPESRAASERTFDWLGALLAIVGVTALVYGIVEEPERGWTSDHVIGGIAAGSLLLAGFVFRQLRVPAPLVDLRLFRSGRFGWSTLAFVVVGFALAGVLFILTPFLQIVQGNDAQQTGVRLLPMIGGIMLGALPSDRVTARVGLRAIVATGLLVTAGGALLLGAVGPDTTFAQLALAEGVLGLGLGLAMPPAADAILGELPAAEAGAGMALTRTLQFVAMSLGVAVLGSVLNGAYRAGIADHLGGLSAVARSAAEESLVGATRVPHLFSAAADAYATGMSAVMVVSAAVLAGAAVLVALFLPARSR